MFNMSFGRTAAGTELTADSSVGNPRVPLGCHRAGRWGLAWLSEAQSPAVAPPDGDGNLKPWGELERAGRGMHPGRRCFFSSLSCRLTLSSLVTIHSRIHRTLPTVMDCLPSGPEARAR